MYLYKYISIEATHSYIVFRHRGMHSCAYTVKQGIHSIRVSPYRECIPILMHIYVYIAIQEMFSYTYITFM